MIFFLESNDETTPKEEFYGTNVADEPSVVESSNQLAKYEHLGTDFVVSNLMESFCVYEFVYYSRVSLKQWYKQS